MSHHRANILLFSTCAHFRRVPETVHPDTWWERWRAGTWSCTRGPRHTRHLPSSVSWSNTWSGSWSNSHPGSRPSTGSGSRSNPRSNSRPDPRTISRTISRAVSGTTTFTASSARYAPAFCLCLAHIHTASLNDKSSELKCGTIAYNSFWCDSVDVQCSSSHWSHVAIVKIPVLSNPHTHPPAYKLHVNDGKLWLRL